MIEYAYRLASLENTLEDKESRLAFMRLELRRVEEEHQKILHSEMEAVKVVVERTPAKRTILIIF